MKSSIFMEGIEFYAFHGYSDQERTVGNTFYIDLELQADLFKAMTTDNLEDTVSYADIYETLKKEMAVPSRLLEHVAGRIVNTLFAGYPAIDRIRIKVTKQTPPMGGQIKKTGVSFTFDRFDIA